MKSRRPFLLLLLLPVLLAAFLSALIVFSTLYSVEKQRETGYQAEETDLLILGESASIAVALTDTHQSAASALEAAAAGKVDEAAMYRIHTEMVDKLAALGKRIEALSRTVQGEAANKEAARKLVEKFGEYRNFMVMATDIAAIDPSTAARYIHQAQAAYIDFTKHRNVITSGLTKSAREHNDADEKAFDEMLRWVMTIGVAGLAAMLLLSLLSARVLSRRLVAVSEALSALVRSGESPPPLQAIESMYARESGEFKEMAQAVLAFRNALLARQEAEQQVRRLSLAVDQSPNSIVITNLDGRIEYVNHGFVDATGYSEDEAIGQNPRILQSGKTPQATYEEMWAALSAGRPWKGEFINRRKNGEEYTEIALISPIRQTGGIITHYLAIKQDFTERKRLEAELEKHRDHLEDLVAERTAKLQVSEEALRHAQQIAHIGSWEWDIPSDRLAWSDETYRIFGTAPQSFLPTYETCLKSVHPDDREAVANAVKESLERKSPCTIEHRICLADGGVRVVQQRSEPRLDADGNLQAMVGTMQDITEREQVQEALRRSEEQLRLLLDSTAEAIYGIDMQGNCTFCNPACLRMLGYSRVEDLLGKNMHQQIHHKHSDGTCFPVEDCRIYQAFQIGVRAHVDDEVLWRADGMAFSAEYWSHPQYRDGQVVGAVVTFLDITERKQAETELLQAKEAAETANRAKSEFLATMSHEIRTPMNGIIGMTELALDTELTLNQREYLDTVRSSAESLLTIINDILDFSKIESGMFELEAVPFNLHELVREAVKPLVFRADQKGLELHSSIAGDVPGLVSGDPTRLRQVLVNLVGNAIKFTKNGKVGLDVAVEQSLTGAVELHFVVLDRGIGISADQQLKIFEPFSQADSSTTRHYGGTGLGLGISKSLIELMGGRIWLESEPGQGSRFHFIVRLGEVSTAAQTGASVAKKGAGQPAGSAKPARILLVEDNAVNRKLAITRLEQWGHAVTTAENGQQALDCLSQQNFDLILMDIQMPVMGGYEATAIIREREGQTGRHTPILAMTANAMNGDRERCLQAGMDGYVSKPVRAEELFNTIEPVLSGGKFTAGTAMQTSFSTSAGFDYPAALARADQEVMEIIGELVLEDCPRLLADVVKAVDEGDQETLKRSAHTLKGLLGNFGETPALIVAETADMLMMTGRFNEVPALIPDIETGIAGFLDALAEHLHPGASSLGE